MTAKQQKESTQRGLRLPVTLDEWLVQQAEAKGYRSVQEFVLDIIRDRREAEIGTYQAPPRIDPAQAAA